MSQGELVVRAFRLIPFHASGTLPSLGNFGGLYIIPVNLCIGNITIIRGTAGSSGTTTITVTRTRAGVPTILATLSVTQAAGANATNTVSLGTGDVLANIDASDILSCQLTAVEAGTPRDLSVCVECR